MKKIDKAMLYCIPFMCRLGRRPSIFALPSESEKGQRISFTNRHTNVCLVNICHQVQQNKHRNKPHLDWDSAIILNV